MHAKKYNLIAAIACTLCAAVWLLNGMLDTALHLYLSLPRHLTLAFMWTAGAVFWWIRWKRCKPCSAIDVRKDDRKSRRSE